MIVGPAPCKACGAFVWWDGHHWCERIRRGLRWFYVAHRCAVAA